ncbi:electron transfer flavoprotein subunit alpha/FixB family protein [Oceanisphaera psychrotolerans]|uniref:Electron transfer flavoprotein subunit alpha n=1 Tax=Oceanisphaera psychrotolerans TaxID=1414654 RepID=A0A1J4QAZ7_9GAMM|nr:FAD-binding protein [Oceanisphaera psychrotolerans]OIN05600.1 electron transfer flavoprotein subunit beta [Oceanisphaera psychrotolerans]
MAILVIADHDNNSIVSSTYNTLGAATQIGGDIDILVMGSNCSAVTEAAAAIPGVRRVLSVDNDLFAQPLAEDMAPLVQQYTEGYSHLLASNSTFAKNLMPRVAALLDVPQISDISAVIDADTFERPIYAGNALATVRSRDAVKVITVRSTKFEAVAATGGSAESMAIDALASQSLARFVSRSEAKSEGPELSTARIVISGGRGMGNGENFALLDTVAAKLGAAVGASRAAVDAGFVPNDYQVGQTGKVVAPDLYIAVGISGAIQHLAGMKDSKMIVAINKDPDAPIFQVADYGIVGDLFDVMPELDKAL